MNTKSMILALNSLLLFNTVYSGFSIASVRKKLVNSCVALGKKSLILMLVTVITLLTTLGTKGAYVRSKISTAKKASHASQFSPVGSTCKNVVSVPAQPYSELSGLRPRYVPFKSTAASAKGRVFRFDSKRGSSNTQDEEEEEITPSLDEMKSRIKFEEVLDDIRNKRFSLSYLPKKLCGPPGNQNLLETMPKELISLILQFIHKGDFYHERSFYVPPHHSDPYLLRGEPQTCLQEKQEVTINFIDGKPRQLEIVLCSPGQAQYYEPRSHAPADIIRIDTYSLFQAIEKNISIQRAFPYLWASSPMSYIQRGIGGGRNGELYVDGSFFENPFALPLIQQLTSIHRDNPCLACWASDNSARDEGSSNRRIYSLSPYCDGYSQISDKPIKYGIQRNLTRERATWFLPKGNHVGIYEKAQAGHDEDCALEYPDFESVTQDPAGNTFHLVQVIREQTPVWAISLPHTPVYIKDPEGNEIKEWLGRPPEDATAHLRDESKYPENIDIVALGFNSTHTNNRCSLYKQRGVRWTDYPPELLLHQKDFLTPGKRKEMLYPDEPVKMQYNALQLGIIVAQRYLKSKVRGKRKGYLE